MRNGARIHWPEEELDPGSTERRGRLRDGSRVEFEFSEELFSGGGKSAWAFAS